MNGRGVLASVGLGPRQHAVHVPAISDISM
jgi:hypothetical protein